MTEAVRRTPRVSKTCALTIYNHFDFLDRCCAALADPRKATITICIGCDADGEGAVGHALQLDVRYIALGQVEKEGEKERRKVVIYIALEVVGSGFYIVS